MPRILLDPFSTWEDGPSLAYVAVWAGSMILVAVFALLLDATTGFHLLSLQFWAGFAILALVLGIPWFLIAAIQFLIRGIQRRWPSDTELAEEFE